MPKAKQLSVRVENRPGALAHVARILGDAKVNILAFLATTSGAEGAVHIVPDNVNKAKKALEGAGFSCTEADVLHVEVARLAARTYRRPDRRASGAKVEECGPQDRRASREGDDL